MSNELDSIFQSLYDWRTPKEWQFAYQSLKPLKSWTKDLQKRVSFFKKLLEKGEPTAFWLWRFAYLMSFLTAVLQRSEHAKAISLRSAESTSRRATCCSLEGELS